MEAMFVQDCDGVLDVDDLPDDIPPIDSPADEDEFSGSAVAARLSGSDVMVGHTMQEIERYYIEKTLELTCGNRKEAANLLGMPERTLYRRIKEFGLN
jgi:two-component system response regulator HydG